MFAGVRVFDQAERRTGETPWFSRRSRRLGLVDRAMTGRTVLEQDWRDVPGERDGARDGVGIAGRRPPARRERERTRENDAGAKGESDEEILLVQFAAHQGTES
jgi:hypothetical protein